jgi:hypothetical protein
VKESNENLIVKEIKKIRIIEKRRYIVENINKKIIGEREKK